VADDPTKLDPVPCSLCGSPQTVKTNQIATRSFHFCLTCGKSFERRVEKEPPRPKPDGT
jgi:hypothetical protein